MKWTCALCHAINPDGSGECHNCKSPIVAIPMSHKPATPNEFPPRAWVHWTENPRQGAAKLYASPSGPTNKTNPNWTPIEYLSLAECEALLAIERAKAFEEAAEMARSVSSFHGPAGIPRRIVEEIEKLAKAAREEK